MLTSYYPHTYLRAKDISKLIFYKKGHVRRLLPTNTIYQQGLGHGQGLCQVDRVHPGIKTFMIPCIENSHSIIFNSVFSLCMF